MIAEAEVRQLVDDLFEEEALVIGGLVAVHRLDDELVWRLMKSFDIIRSRFLQRIGNRDAHALLKTLTTCATEPSPIGGGAGERVGFCIISRFCQARVRTSRYTQSFRRLFSTEQDAHDNCAASQPDLTPHPAIEDFLLRVRRGQQ